MSEPVFDVSFIVVSFNTRDLLRECLRSIAEHSAGFRVETFVVDNVSRDGSPEMVRREFPEVRLHESPVNLGFGAANNVALRLARGRYIVLLNSDAFLTPGSLAAAVAHMDAYPRAGAGGAYLCGRDGAPQPSARSFPSLWNDFVTMSGLAYLYPQSRLFGAPDRTWANPLQPAAVHWVPGAFLILRPAALRQAGIFDEDFFLYYEEVDLCRRLRAAGFAIHYWPDFRIVHIGGESSRTVSTAGLSEVGAQVTLWRMRSMFLYYRKHHGAKALGALWLEAGWHRLRAWKCALTGADAKARESRQLVALLYQAWSDTQGGRVSPPRPW